MFGGVRAQLSGKRIRHRGSNAIQRLDRPPPKLSELEVQRSQTTALRVKHSVEGYYLNLVEGAGAVVWSCEGACGGVVASCGLATRERFFSKERRQRPRGDSTNQYIAVA